MNLLAAALYDPAGAVSKATSSLLAMTAFDTTNLRLAVTVPSHGIVRFRLRCAVTGATTVPTVLLGVLNGATVVGRVVPMYGPFTANAATQDFCLDAEFTATGLTPGATNFDAAYGVEVVVASTNIKYGGPNNTTTNDAWGAFVFEAWDPRPLATGLAGGVNVTQFNGSNATSASGRPEVNVSHYGGSAGTFASGRPEVNTSHAAGTAWGSGAITAASIAADAITAAKIADGAIDAATLASDTITAAKIATGAITSAKFAAGAIDASAVAADAIGASELAADAVAEIADAIWDEAMSGHTTLGTYGQWARAKGLTGEVNTGSATTTAFAVDGFTEATDDHFNGMIITFTSGALIGQSRTITDYTGSSQTVTLGEALTDAPADNDDFVIQPGPMAGGTLQQIARLFFTLLNSSGQIQAGTVASDTIAAAKIATGAITSAKFASGAIDAAAIADNAIDAGAIAADAITAAKIADGAIDAATFAAGAINAAAIAADAITAAKIANGAIDAATFSADVDAEILSYIVDDATRVDASALNTLSGHDPGEAIMGATDLGTGAGLTSLASAANLATVDGIVDDILVDTSTTLQGELDGIQADTEDIQTRLPAALVSGRIDASVGAIAANAITAASIAADAITDAKVASDVTIASVTGAVGSVTGNVGGNVAGSVGSVTAKVNADIVADFEASVVDHASNSASTFKTDLTEAADDHWLGAYLRFTSGSLTGQVRKITGYNGTSKFVTFTTPFTAEPGDGDDFDIVNQ